MTIQNLYDLYTISSGIEINSKKVKNGSIFFSIRGKNFDGNQFAHEAISNGAIMSIVDNRKYSFTHKKILFVKDSLSILQKLALYHRIKLKNIPIIAITGSNGKTTTKELTTAILSKKYEIVHSTKNNLNNHIGIPLTILSMSKNTQISVIEIGASHENEVDNMCSIINPDYGYITNFGKSHLEGFKNMKGVIRGKLELYDFLRKNKKKVFVNGDDPIQLINSIGINRYIFSEKENSDVRIKYLWKKTYLESILCMNDMKIVSPLVGTYNLYNIASSITIGKYFKVPLIKIKKAVEEFIPKNHRSQILEKNHIKIIMDCYNANPSSMRESLTFFNNKLQGNKIAILGDMLELGVFSKNEHKEIILFLDKSNINKIFLIGEIFFNTNIKTSDKIVKFFNKNRFIQWINNKSFQTDYILIKGSRKNALESLIPFL
ncbi:UDP-N-acetylmuramoyl-tripeptide--D-alanyl-D-alanine ligase [Blattabacterium sp. (Mastotermes darwiniensis) str. MADAR]|uniref:UDP-N-acetylmuramoyl-tripeptide--D-alanyl-D- alanine ligase n=1 Tax=Blattabacterium sp. (Mastotermes darwiniensis) TaxID=39768 RepID=UPI000231DEEB|nr:UDP-N-acetylmuramoyl-tripeptide--D-alanyl-D-alanine ligase [Blattabacterium sp. (Mastotermes darwiniensis)]AER40799.1 UDP-N-acetylmuramoyl-tripeptide--D-alanyl-D-alanine ligase [Blattabacterium sp. (Mastotermes darwiniensis) str. MADAR]